MRRLCGAAVALVLLTGCGADGGDVEGRAGALTTASAGASAATTTAAPRQLPFLATDLPDGRHAAFLTGIDVAARTLTIDVVQLLTGDAADEAFWKRFPSTSPEPVPDDYFIVNDSSRSRTLSVDRGVAVSVVWKDAFSVPNELSPRSLDFEALPEYFGSAKLDGRLSHDPFWLRLVDGVVVGIEEQYVP